MKVFLDFGSPKCPCESPHTYTKTTNLHLGCLGVEDLLLFIFLIFILCILYFRVFSSHLYLGCRRRICWLLLSRLTGNPTKAGAHRGFPSKDQHWTPGTVSKLWPQYFNQTWKGCAALIAEKMMHSECCYRQNRKGMVRSHSYCLAEFVCKSTKRVLVKILSAKGTSKVRQKNYL